MTSSFEIVQRLNQLPPEAQQQALDYINTLFDRYTPKPNTIPKKRQLSGLWAGQIWMSDDFDAHLSDFQISFFNQQLQ